MNPLEHAEEVDPPHLIRQRVNHPGLPGPTETTVTFVAVGGGTEITHTIVGMGESLEWENARQATCNGLDETIADMALYLRTGVGSPRHTVFRSFDLLQGTREVLGGLEVFNVPEGGLAAEIGLQPGDIVVGFDGAGVFGIRELCFALRLHPPGDIAEVTWVRDGKVLTARGQTTGMPPLRF